MTAISDLLSANQVNALRRTNDFRLTLESGVPVSTSDQLNKTTIYMTPYLGKQIALYVDGAWVIKETSEISLALGSASASTPFDIFAYWTGSAVALELVEWTNDTTRATALAFQDGIYVKSGDATRRYIGTGRTNSNPGNCVDADAARFVWNWQNQVTRRLYKYDGTSHTYATLAWRYWANNVNLLLTEWVQGLAQTVFPEMHGAVQGYGAAGYLSLFVSGNYFGNLRAANSSGNAMYLEATTTLGPIALAAGYNTLNAQEYGQPGWSLYSANVFAGIPG